MTTLCFWVLLDVCFLAGTIPEFLGPSKRHIAQLQARRPEWSASDCRQFFHFFRTVMAMIATIVTVYLAMQVREVSHR